MFKQITIVVAGAVAIGLGFARSAEAAVITFDELLTGQTSFGFDGDDDGIEDVIFSTTDPAGFNTIGPGANQNFIQEPGLEGTSLISPDLRVDFMNGAVGSISFGYALNSTTEDDQASFSLFDSSDALIASQSSTGVFTSTESGTSSFPEGSINLNFGGVAAYGIFDFTSDSGRFIIDNFEGTFGSTENITPPETVPEPASILGLAAIGAIASGGALKKKAA